MSNIRVVHIITGLSDGGAEGVLFRLCKYDKKNNHFVVSLTGSGKYASLLRDEGVDVVFLNLKSSAFGFLLGITKLFFLLRRNRSSIVQTWMYHSDLIGGLISKLAGVKTVYWNVRHTSFEPGSSKRTTMLLVKICASLSGLIPKKIIYCAYEAKVVHEAIGYKKGKDKIISNGYDLNIFKVFKSQAAEVFSELSFNNDYFLLGMVGRYDAQKDHQGLIEALSIVARRSCFFKIFLIGHDLDENNQNLKSRITFYQLDENVILLGQRTDIPAIMNAIDLHVLSSSFGEGFPNVIAEAMACGTPCVTTDVGDAAVIVGDTGWVVPPKNPQALASAILEAINEVKNNPQAWKIRKQASRDRIVNNFSVEKMISRYHQVWDNIK